MWRKWCFGIACSDDVVSVVSNNLHRGIPRPTLRGPASGDGEGPGVLWSGLVILAYSYGPILVGCNMLWRWLRCFRLIWRCCTCWGCAAHIQGAIARFGGGSDKSVGVCMPSQLVASKSKHDHKQRRKSMRSDPSGSRSSAPDRSCRRRRPPRPQGFP